MSANPKTIRNFVRRGVSVIAALGLAIVLSGCVIVPWQPYHHSHHHWG